jgi:hypothetical protein
LLPDGLNGSIAPFNASWLQPGGTWSYTVLGGNGVYVSLALLFWVCYFALAPNHNASSDEAAADVTEKANEPSKKKA